MWGSFFEYFSRAMMRSPGKGVALALALLIGGILSILSIYAFLNFVDTDAKKLLNYQYVKYLEQPDLTK